MMDKSIVVDGLAVPWEEVLEFVGSKVCLDGNARYAIARRSAQANKFLAKWRPVLSPKKVAPKHCQNHHVAGFSLEVEPVDDGERDKISTWSVRMVANVIGLKKPPWMEMDQRWRLWHRTGMNVLTAIRERVLSWAGHVARMDCSEICAKALTCRGLQWWRWRQLHRKQVEKDKMGWSAPKTVQHFQTGGHGAVGGFQVRWKCRCLCGISPFVYRMAATCSGPWALERVCKNWDKPSPMWERSGDDAPAVS